MFEPVRGGTRGGQAEFKWSDVSQDKDRENYLGHSINAPTGRWQKNKDIHWYQRDMHEDEEARIAEEIRVLKEQEAEALAAALGFGTGNKPGVSNASGSVATGSNAVSVPNTVATTPQIPRDPHRDLEKEERKRRKAERKARKEEKKRRAEGGEDTDEHRHGHRYRHHHSRSRSRSPRRRSRERNSDGPSRLRTPPASVPNVYGDIERERDRGRDRRRWDETARRDRAGMRWGRE